MKGTDIWLNVQKIACGMTNVNSVAVWNTSVIIIAQLGMILQTKNY
jgi:hypothetical protein